MLPDKNSNSCIRDSGFALRDVKGKAPQPDSIVIGYNGFISESEIFVNIPGAYINEAGAGFRCSYSKTAVVVAEIIVLKP